MLPLGAATAIGLAASSEYIHQLIAKSLVLIMYPVDGFVVTTPACDMVDVNKKLTLPYAP
jgi:hypothetical protein